MKISIYSVFCYASRLYEHCSLKFCEKGHYRYIMSTHYMVYGEEWVTFYLLANTRHPLTWWQDAIEQVIQSCWHLSPNDGYGQGILQELPVYPGRQAETRNTILIKTKGPQALTVIWVSETSHWLLMRRAHICISTALS